MVHTTSYATLFNWAIWTGVVGYLATLVILRHHYRSKMKAVLARMEPGKKAGIVTHLKPKANWAAVLFCLGLGVIFPMFALTIAINQRVTNNQTPLIFPMTFLSALAIVGSVIVAGKAFGRIKLERPSEFEPLAKPLPADESFEFAGRVDAR